MADDDLRRELAYYKRHLDEAAAERISTEHQRWALHRQLLQKEQGFQLMSKLALAFGTHTDLSAMFRLAVLAINSAMDMDRTAIFVRAKGSAYAPAHIAGLPDADAERIAGMTLELPDELMQASGLLVVKRSSERTPLSAQLSEVFGVETFICVPVMGHREPLGLIFSGRLGAHSSLIRSVNEGDVDTFRAISAILQAVTQHTHLALLEQTERLKAQFFADIAHEFRTPLTLTLGPLQQIMAGKWGSVPEPVAERLQLVERNQERLLRLINQILELARLEASATELCPELIDDVNVLVSDCVAHFRSGAEVRGLGLKLTLDPELGDRPLLADRDRLERALFNLVSNALKFTDKGQIEVSTTRRGGTLELAVTDSGIGIPEQELPHVFDRFRRATEPELRRSAGSGIGLALVKQIAELHGGHVTVQSRAGQGSRFTLTLPFVDPHSVSASRASVSPSEAPPIYARVAPIDEMNRQAEADFDAARPIVLYVEDDADLRLHVRDILRESCNVFLAADGLDGLEKARRYCPDAIITDQLMPRMAGREFLAAVRDDEELRSTPVVVLTAQYATEGRIESLDAGADDYVTKPFHEAELRARVLNLVRSRRQERELAELNRRLRLQVREQMAELTRAGELERFLPRSVLDKLRRGSGEPRAVPLRRQVTVLVTELSALAALGGALDEATAASMANETIEAVSTICAARGGVVDGLTAGRVSALFGTTHDTAAEDSAWSAAQAAFEIHQTILRLNADARRRGLKAEQPRGIGVASGWCLIGAFGGPALLAYTAIGPATQVAARLHVEAAPGSIVCDEATRELLGRRVHARALDTHRHEIRLLAEGEPPPIPSPGVKGAPAGSGRVFQREGDYWTVVFDGRVFRLKNSKGALFVAFLLARPHIEVHVFELVRASEHDGSTQRVVSPSEAAELGLRQVTAEDSAALLDERAKQAYRERIRDLEEQIEEARSFGDAERAARAESERTLLAEELAAALGLGGRDRPETTAAERQRVNVTRTIKAVMQKIMQEHPELGRHLGTSLNTGMFCSYTPPPGAGGWDVGF